MAVLETIRVKFGVLITVLIAIALLSFIVDPSVFNSCTSGNGDVMEIEGEDITYLDYQTALEKNKISMDVLYNGAYRPNTFQTHQMLEQNFLFQYGMTPKFEAAGITVPDSELASYLQFTQEGQLYNQLASLKEQFPQYEYPMQTIVDQIRRNLYVYKYGSLFASTAYCNASVIADEVNDNADSTAFIRISPDYSLQVEVSDEECKAYYESHKVGFKDMYGNGQEGRYIEFATFDIAPSAKDLEAARAEADKNLKDLLADSAEDNEDVKYYDYTSYNLPFAVTDYINGKDASSAVVASEDEFYAVNVLDEKVLPSSIEIKVVPAAGESVADSLFDAVQSRTLAFNAINDTYSEPMSFVENKLNTAFKVNDRKNRQNVWVKVIKRSDKKLHKKVAYVKNSAFVSEETDDAISAKAKEFASKATSYEEFSAQLAAVGQNDNSHRSQIYPSYFDLPYSARTSYANAREVIKWAYEATVGQVSPVYKLDEVYVVAALKAVNADGYLSYELVADQIRNILRNEKLLAATAEKVKTQIAGLENMKEIAAKLETSVQTDNIIFSYSALSPMDMNSGNFDHKYDPKFVGAVSASEVGKVYGPYVGSGEIFVYKVLSRNKRNAYTEDMAIQHNQYKAAYASQMAAGELMKTVRFNDERVKFM